MATIVTRAGKGSALTWTEADANFTNLNTGKLEYSGGALTAGGVLYGNGTAAAITAAGTSKQVIASNGSSAPSWATLDLTYLPDAAFKKSVQAATTANITLSGTQTIDGVALVAGDRVLVKDQTTPSQNGIYQVAAGAWTRPADADTSSKMAGAIVNVDGGTLNGGRIYENDFRITDTLGTTAMTWAFLIDDSSAQTLSNKTLTSPTVNGGTINNASIGATTASTGRFTTMTLVPANASLAAWTTNGVALTQASATYTDTTSTGTVSDIRLNNLNALTLAASNALTVINLYGTYFTAPVAGTNVTVSNNRWGLGTDSLLVNGTFATSNSTAINLFTSAAGTVTVGTTSSTGNMTFGQSTVTQTVNIATGAVSSGNTKTLNIGTAGVSGSTTAITIGSAVSGATQTTTVNGRVTLAPIGASAAAWTTNGIALVQSAATFTDTTSTGTVAEIMMNRFAAQTLAASSVVTATLLYGTYFSNPVAGTNVTATGAYAIGADSLLVGGAIDARGTLSFSPTSAATIYNIGGSSQTGTIAVGRSTVSQAVNLASGATASGSTKTVNIGTGGVSGSTTTMAIGSTFGTTVTANGAWNYSGSALVNGTTGGIGYGTGAGGTVTQATSRTTGVTLNRICGAITLFSTTTTANQVTTFTVTNSLVAATDNIVVTQQTGTGVYFFTARAAAGSFNISVLTPSAVGTAEAPVINFAVIKSVTA